MNSPLDDTDDAEIETLLFSLVYCSRATETLSIAAVNQIVSTSQQNNSRQEITGLLVYSCGIFFQWLEGKQHSVEQLMTVISADERHNTVVVLNRAEEVRERVFSGWDMELVPPEDIREVLLDAIASTEDAKSVGALKMLMKELDSRVAGRGV